ncbi:MAG: SH3 domain-containing protein [Clostridiales bacterium]|nr:SH3 domain-containing protein [Clostridiales bacterium]
MKRLLAMSIAMILLVGMLVLPASSFAATQTGVVHGGWLRLRAQPNFNAYTISSYYTGTVVTILETLSGWYRVTTPDGNTGYMYSAYVNLSGGGGGGTGTYQVWSANGLGVRMRSGPGTGYRILAVYSVGTSVTVLQKGAYWSYIRVGSRTGYMMNQFLVSGSTPVPTPDGNATVWSANGYGVRLRTGPGKGYAIIGVYSVGTTVKVLERGPAGGWDHIQVGSRVGYMMNEFLHYYGSTDVTGVTLNYNTPVKGSEMKAASITPYGATVNYHWFVDGTEVSTSSTYVVSVADVGKHIRLVVTGKGSYTGSASVTSQNAVLDSGEITSVTLNTMDPVVSNVLKVQDLQPVGASVQYQWSVDGVNKGTGATYTVQSADQGKQIKLVVTGKSPFHGTSDVTTNPVQVTGSLTSATIVNDTNPGLSIPNVGDKLRATYEPALATVRYEWYVTDGVNRVKVGTGSTYTVTKNDYNRYAGGYIELDVYGTGAYMSVTDPQTANTDPIKDLPLLGSVTLNITSPKVGNTIEATAKLKNGVETTDVRYVWYADGVEIAGEVLDTLTVDSTLLGKVLKVQAIGDNIACAGSVTSGGTTAVKGVINGVTIDNTSPEVGDIMTAIVDPAEATVTYAWYGGAEISTMKKVGEGKTHTVSLPEYSSGYRYYKVKATGTGAYSGSSLESTPTSPSVPAPFSVMMAMAAEEGLTLDENFMQITTDAPTGSDEGAGEPTPTGSDEGAGEPTPTGSDESAGEPTPTGSDEGAGEPTPTGSDEGAGEPAPTGSGEGAEEPTASDSAESRASLVTDPTPTETYQVLLSNLHPEVGEELAVTLIPPLESGVMVRYEWYVGGNRVYEPWTSTYIVKETDAGQQIMVMVFIGDQLEPVTATAQVEEAASLLSPPSGVDGEAPVPDEWVTGE